MNKLTLDQNNIALLNFEKYNPTKDFIDKLYPNEDLAYLWVIKSSFVVKLAIFRFDKKQIVIHNRKVNYDKDGYFTGLSIKENCEAIFFKELNKEKITTVVNAFKDFLIVPNIYIGDSITFSLGNIAGEKLIINNRDILTRANFDKFVLYDFLFSKLDLNFINLMNLNNIRSTFRISFSTTGSFEAAVEKRQVKTNLKNDNKFSVHFSSFNSNVKTQKFNILPTNIEYRKYYIEKIIEIIIRILTTGNMDDYSKLLNQFENNIDNDILFKD